MSRSVTHFSKSDPLLLRVKHLYNFDPFFQLWPIFASLTHFYKSDPFFNVWPIFSRLTHFPDVTHFYMCDPFFIIVTHFYKCGPFFQECLFLKSKTFLQVWPTFLVCPMFRVWRNFASVNHFCKRAASTAFPFMAFLSSHRAYVSGRHLKTNTLQ